MSSRCGGPSTARGRVPAGILHGWPPSRATTGHILPGLLARAVWSAFTRGGAIVGRLARAALSSKWGGQRDSNPRPQDSQNCVRVDDKRLRKVQSLRAHSDRANATWHDVARIETSRESLDYWITRRLDGVIRQNEFTFQFPTERDS